MGYWRSFNDDANSMLVRLKNMLLPNYAPHGTPEAPILSLDIRRSPWLYSGHTFEETQNLHAEHKSQFRDESSGNQRLLAHHGYWRSGQ